MRLFRVVVATIVCLGPVTAARAQGQAPVVNHLTVGMFDSIPEQYLRRRPSCECSSSTASVGKNVDMGPDRRRYPHDSAPNYCKRWQHSAPEFSVTPSPWTRTYSRTRWQFGAWPGTGIPPEISCGGVDTSDREQQLDCFIRHIDANPNGTDVAAFQFSYLEVTDQSDIADPVRGFFGTNPPGAENHAHLVALRGRHPSIRFVLMTSSLGRSIGTPQARDFERRRPRLRAGERLALVRPRGDDELHADRGALLRQS